MAHVDIVDPPRMNLLGLILASVLERNLAEQAGRTEALRRLRGKVVVRSGEMAVTLDFAADGASITRGADARPDALLAGPLDALTDLALGRNLVSQGLRLKLRGNLLLLLRVWKLLRVAAPAATPAAPR